jgi:hypothetical protein
MDRGGPTPARVDRRQEQYEDQRATPPPTTRVDGQARGPTAPPSAAHARDDRCGLTARQQQPPTDLSRHALSLYRQCVAAGQWARICLENRPDGQHITFASRPMVAAPAAASAAADVARRRRPNQRRKAKKELWLRTRQQQQLQAAGVAAAGLGSYAQAVARAASQRGAATAAAPTLPAAATEMVAAPSCSPAYSSPMLTRSRKRKKQSSPGAASAVVQLDGAEQTPPSSPPEPLSPESPPRLAVFSASQADPDVPPVVPPCVGPPVLVPGESSARDELRNVPSLSSSPANPPRPPPPPPPWSRFLPTGGRLVICRSCLRNSHTPRLGYTQCSSCQYKELFGVAK